MIRQNANDLLKGGVMRWLNTENGGHSLVQRPISNHERLTIEWLKDTETNFPLEEMQICPQQAART